MAAEATPRVRSATGVSWGGMAAGWMSGQKRIVRVKRVVYNV